MGCCQCQGIENMFDKKAANRQLKRYLKKGPSKTTSMLLDAINKKGVQGLNFLDIGGGIGAIQYDLIKAGASNGTSIEASSAFFDVVKEEALQNGLAERVNFKYGDFTATASDVDSADIVTLDKVICCYDDMSELVGLSSKLARKIYAVIYPRDVWWTKLALLMVNFYPRIKGSSFRVFIHPTKKVEEIIFGNGLKRNYYATTLFWQVAIFTR
ncbi:MAG TPA: methyltransferase domain-containing protein [Candidatus Marinimicrobia bacterium]|jgi:magnesium-protoporphyrin O-methyltransferase|nr:methyltransferase domain-containing protein [Candidatus Neomarinimicrobiota bacterium]